MISIKIVCVGKMKERYYADAAEEYLKRLSGYCKTEVVELPEHRIPQDPSDAQIAAALDKERVAIESKLPAGAAVIALCVEGRETDSSGLSKLLSDYTVRGISRVCFVVGGSLGLHETIKQKAGLCLSLSKMTFQHSLARIILLEQLYRALNLSEGGKYHK